MGSSVLRARFILRTIWNNFGWMGLVAQMQTLPFTYTLLPWVHEPWAHEIIFLEGHECYCAKKKRKWRSWETNMETFLKAFSLQNLQHLFKFTAVFMFDFLVVVLSACSGALLDSMPGRGDFFTPFSTICCKCMILNPQINILQH